MGEVRLNQGTGGGIYSEDLSAVAANVLLGLTYIGQDTDDEIGTGTMPDYSHNTINPLASGETYNIPLGYHDGTEKVSVKTLSEQTPATATSAFIVKNYTAWGNGIQIVGAAGGGASTTSILSGTIVAIPNQIYTGDEIKPAVTLSVNGRTLTENTDFTVMYSDNVDVGTCTITVTGINNYKDSKSTTFQIEPMNLGNSAIFVEPIIDEIFIAHTDCTPQLNVRYNTDYLQQDVDYSVSYSNNNKAGVAQIVLTGKNNFVGNKTVTFNILPCDITSNYCTITIDLSDRLYTGSAIVPPVSVVDFLNTPLILGQDYELEYFDNTNIGTATITVQGMGNYQGVYSASFEIVSVT